MSYSVTAILHRKENKNGLHKVQIRIIYKRSKIYQSTNFSVKKNQFEGGRIVNHPQAAAINKVLKKDINGIEGKIIVFIDLHNSKGLGFLKDMIKGRRSLTTFKSFCASFIEKNKANFSPATIANYNVLIRLIEEYQPGINISEIDYNFMTEFEAFRRGEDKGNNTVVKNMQTLISLMNKAHAAGVIEKGTWSKYKKPRYIQKVPTWLTEKELEEFEKVTFPEKISDKKKAGMYYLLCCYAGYRIGTAKGFDYSKMVNGNKITVRARKNNTIVSMPIYKRLQKVLEYCKDNPLNIAEPLIRLYVKSLAADAGINKDVIFHSSRHTFAMLLMSNGFTVDEAAELLGDTPLVAKVYARIHNDLLDKKIMERLG